MNKLSDTEYEIVNYIWENKAPITFEEIRKAFPKWKKQTINTFLLRAIQKNIIKKDGEIRKSVYYPVINKKEYIILELKECSKKYFETDEEFKKFVKKNFN